MATVEQGTSKRPRADDAQGGQSAERDTASGSGYTQPQLIPYTVHLPGFDGPAETITLTHAARDRTRVAHAQHLHSSTIAHSIDERGKRSKRRAGWASSMAHWMPLLTVLGRVRGRRSC